MWHFSMSVGGRPTPTTRAVFELICAEVPEYVEAIGGGRLLDVGCGVAGATLATASILPNMRAVAIELAKRPAFALGRLVFEGMGVPFAPTAEELIAEAEASGLVLHRLATTDLGRIVLMRRPGES